MKKTTLLLLSFLVITSYVNGQKGGILLYGDAAIQSLKNDNSTDVVKDDIFIFSPGIGYGICKNFIIGINILYGTNKHTSVSSTDKDNMLAIGPFLRYIHPITDIFDFRGQLDISYLSENTKYTNNLPPGNTNKIVLTGFGIDVGPSIGVHVGKHWGLNFGYGSLAYQSTSQHTDNGDGTDDIKTKDNDFQLVVNYTSLRWGISYMFGGGKEEK